MTSQLLESIVVADPYPVFNRIRENAPVYYDDDLDGWVFSRYGDVAAALTDPRFSARRSVGGTGVEGHVIDEVVDRWMVFQDPPMHGRLRRPFQRDFAARSIQSLEPSIRDITGNLLGDLSPTKPFDLVGEVALPLPSIVVANMLGVPEQDRAEFQAWSDAAAPLLFGGLGVHDRFEKAAWGLDMLGRYLRGLVRGSVSSSSDGIVHRLARSVGAGGDLSEEELVATSILLIFAGGETTTNLIASGLLALLRHPQQMRALNRDPSRIGPAVEEMLRYDGPTKATVRHARTDFGFRGAPLSRGVRVYLLLAGANRDPQQFRDPDGFYIDRQPNAHLGFSRGIHFCLGATLARLEAQVAVSALIRRFPEMRLAHDADVEYRHTLMSRSPVAVHIQP